MVNVLDKSKVCTKCGKEKLHSEFAKNALTKDGLKSACKKCTNTKERDRRRNNVEDEKARTKRYRESPEGKRAKREYAFFYNYGLTPENYEELIKDGCAVCGTKDNLEIDHDHECCPSNKTCGNCIRGVLCLRHNRGEGFFKTIEEIDALKSYRLRWQIK